MILENKIRKSGKPRNTNRRRQFLLLALLIVLCLFTVQFTMIAKRQQQLTKVTATQVDQIKSLAMYLEAKGLNQNTAPKVDQENLSSLIQRKAESAGIQAIDLINHSDLKTDKEDPYQYTQTQVILSGVTLHSVIRFLHELSLAEPGMNIDKLQLKSAAQNEVQPVLITGMIERHRATLEHWDINLTLKTSQLK